MDELTQWLLSQNRQFTPQSFADWPVPFQSAGNTPYRMPYDPATAQYDAATGMYQAPAQQQEFQKPAITDSFTFSPVPSTSLTPTPKEMNPISEGLQITESTVPQQQTLQQGVVNGTNVAPQGINFLDLFSPVSTETAVFKLGQSLAFDPTNATKSQRTGNTLRGIGAGGKAALSLLRTGLQGAAYQSRQNEAMEDYRNRQGQQSFSHMQDGGQMTQEQFMTGDYLGETTFQPMPNAEIENNEYVQYPDGTTQQAKGSTHENGGIEVSLPGGTKVISDNLKLGGKNARELRKEFDINVKATDTFADAITKYKKKIGLDKLDQEQQDLFKKLEKQDKVEDNRTYAINEQFLAKNIQTTQAAKEPLLAQVSQFTDLIFRKQEEQKGDTSQSDFLQNGGYAPIDANDVAQINAGLDFQFTEEGAQQLFGKELPPNNNTTQTTQQPNRRISQPDFSKIADITGGTNRYTPDGGVVVGDFKQVWLNQRPEYYTGKTPAKEGVDFVYMNPKQYEQFKTTPEYANYKAGYNTQSIASFKDGGKLPKYQNAGRIPSRFEDPSKYVNQTAIGTGYYGEILTNSPQDTLNEIKRLHPKLYSQYFTGQQILPTDTKGYQTAINEEYNQILEDAKKLYGEDSEQYKTLQQQIEQDKFLQDNSVRGIEGKFGNYSSTRPNYALNILPKEDLEKVQKEGVNTSSQLLTKFPELHKKYVQDKGLKSDFWLGALETPTQPTTENETPDAVVDEETVTPTPNMGVRVGGVGFLNLVGQSMPPPGGLIASRMPDADYRNFEAVQQGYEPQLQQLYNQQTAAVAALDGLSPAQRAAAQAGILAQTQTAANQVIGQVSAANRQEAARISNMNTQLYNQMSMVDNNERERFEQKTYQALSNTQDDLFRWFQYNNQLRALNQLQTNQANTLASLFPNTTFTPDGRIVSNGVAPISYTPLPAGVIQENNKK